MGRGVEGVELPVGEGVEGVEEGVEKVGSWLSFSIFSFSLFMYVSYDFLSHSCLLGSFVTFWDVLSMIGRIFPRHWADDNDVIKIFIVFLFNQL